MLHYNDMEKWNFFILSAAEVEIFMAVRIGFVGVGGIAVHHLNNLVHMPDVELVGFYDVDAEKARRTASAYRGVKVYERLDDLFDGGRPDGVYICVPPMAHGDAERRAIERGIPFFVEKPLGNDMERPTELAAAVRERRLLTSVGYHWRYGDSARFARERLKNGTVGMAVGYWMGDMPMVPWWRVQSQSGGQFVEQTTHIVDLLRYLCGEVVEVYAAFALRTMDRKIPGTDVPDVGTVTLKLANGAVASISNTCMLPVYHHVGLDLYCDFGVLEVRGNELREVTKEETRIRTARTNPYQLEDEAFIRALLTGDASGILSDYEDALKTHAVTIAALRSAESGRPVSLS